MWPDTATAGKKAAVLRDSLLASRPLRSRCRTGTREWVPNAGVTAKSARDGKLEYVAGERSAVLDTVIDVVADEVA